MVETADLLQGVVEGYSHSPVNAGRAMGEMLARDRQQFYQDSLEILKTAGPTPGPQYLVSLLIENDLLPEALSDPAQFTLEEAIELVKRVSGIEPLVDVKLARWTLDRLQSPDRKSAIPAVQRILGILEQTSIASRLLPTLVQILRVPEPTIRSKVALLIGRHTRDVKWALGEPDARVRANAIEAVWGEDVRHARRALWELARDSSNRVAGNALLALYRIGEDAAVDALLEMSARASARFRATAAWVMGQTRDARFLEALGRMESDSNESVRRNAALATEQIKQAAG
jgi:hypothetical protein